MVRRPLGGLADQRVTTTASFCWLVCFVHLFFYWFGVSRRGQGQSIASDWVRLSIAVASAPIGRQG